MVFKYQALLEKQPLKSVEVTDVFLMEKQPGKHGNAQHPEQWVLRNQEISSQHPLGKLISFFGSSSHFGEENNVTSSILHSWLHYVVFSLASE